MLRQFLLCSSSCSCECLQNTFQIQRRCCTIRPPKVRRWAPFPSPRSIFSAMTLKTAIVCCCFTLLRVVFAVRLFFVATTSWDEPLHFADRSASFAAMRVQSRPYFYREQSREEGDRARVRLSQAAEWQKSKYCVSPRLFCCTRTCTRPCTHSVEQIVWC